MALERRDYGFESSTELVFIWVFLRCHALLKALQLSDRPRSFIPRLNEGLEEFYIRKFRGWKQFPKVNETNEKKDRSRREEKEQDGESGCGGGEG